MRAALTHKPRKRFGQHFLQDEYVLEQMVAEIAPQPADCMIEIGPGLGALTDQLLKHLEYLHVAEIDRELIAHLQRHDEKARLKIHAGDILDFDFSKLGPQLRVVGNLPYNISSPLLFALADVAECLQDIHIMLQKEVVDRIVAMPGESSYGRLSVMLGYRFEAESLFDVPPESFFPAPKVESAVLRLIPRPATACQADMEKLSRVVKMAFSQRRKMLRNTLKPLFSTERLEALGFDPALRAENLFVADYLRLAAAL